MGATLIPWWDDPAAIKPNEFERGVMTGMLLKCGKSDEPEPTKPEGAVGEWSVEYLFKGGAKLETWVTDDGVKEYGGTLYEQVYLHQRKTYSDGTVDEWEQQLVTHTGKGISLNYGWEFIFNEPTNDSTYNTISLKNVPIRSFPRRVSSNGISITTISDCLNLVILRHCSSIS